MTLSMTDEASDDADCLSVGAAAAGSPAIHVVESNTAGEFAQHIPQVQMPMSAVVPSMSTRPAQQWKQGDRPAFVAMPLHVPAQANPIFGLGMMVGGAAHSIPQSGNPSASSKLSVSFALS